MKKLVIITAAVIFTVVPSLHAMESFANSVVNYTAGSGVGSFTNPNAALGKPGALAGSSVFSPFNPHFQPSQLARIGEGGSLTLQLENFVIVAPGVRELGIWENIGLADTAFPNGTAGAPATVFGADSAIVEVSADNVSWFQVNGGLPVFFTLPGNYYANSTGAFTASAPAVPVLADFGKPFTGMLSDFNGQTYGQVLATLDGSAGGTWLDLDSTGLAQVGFVRFSGLAPGQTLEIDAVGINGSLIGAAVPEPGVAGLLVAASGLCLGLRRARGTRSA